MPADPAASPPVFASDAQVRLQRADERVLLHLPAPPKRGISDWSELRQQVRIRLGGSERFWTAATPAWIVAGDRLLDSRQLQALEEDLGEVELKLQGVAASRRQTAIAAATSGYSVEQAPLPVPNWQSEPTTPEAEASAAETAAVRAEPLYLQTTVRSGNEVRHAGSVVLVGDVNPGGLVAATGDIIIWGRLRGVAHAGAAGDRQCRIAALRMEPTQLRIAEVVARAPKNTPQETDAEIAYITPGGIRIAPGIDFLRNHTFNPQVNGWSDA